MLWCGGGVLNSDRDILYIWIQMWIRLVQINTRRSTEAKTKRVNVSKAEEEVSQYLGGRKNYLQVLKTWFEFYTRPSSLTQQLLTHKIAMMVQNVRKLPPAGKIQLPQRNVNSSWEPPFSYIPLTLMQYSTSGLHLTSFQ